MTGGRTLAADVWSHWSLLKALQGPEAVVAHALASRYDAVLLADWCSLSGALTFADRASAAGLIPLIGVCVPGPDGSPVRVVGRGPAAWSFLCRLVTVGRLQAWDAAPVEDVVLVLTADAAPPGNGRFPAFFQLVYEPAARVAEGVVPLAAVPIRYPTADLATPWAALARISHEPHAAGGPWTAAPDLVARFGLEHPAVRGWEALLNTVEGPAVPGYQERLPRFPGTQDPDRVLEERARAGLRARVGSAPPTPYEERLGYELSVIRDLGVSAYFLIVADLVAEARRRQIGVGPGRGSAAASLTAWALGITDLDPLEWGLIFERFLNPARKSLPDIDLDVEDVGRSALIGYLRERWGTERVAQIGAYGTFGARAAVRDAGRALDVEPALVDRAARLIPQRPDVTLDRARLEVPDLGNAMAEGHPDWWFVAVSIEGTPRHGSTHAAGVVVAPDAIGDYTPLQADQAVTTLPMQDLDRLGLLKLDLLGLRTLSVVREVRVRTPPPVPEMAAVPRADPETLRLLTHGETEGIFQLDGRGVKELLGEIEPTSVADIMLTVALFRPGPMEHIRDYLKERRAGKLAPLDTGHVMVFQEQLMALVRETAGYSWAEADLFRRAVSKKDHELLAGERARFMSRTVAAGRTEREASGLWEQIEAFADYGFNKAHAVCYGLLAYYMAYLKAHHPYAFWAGEWATRGHGESLGRAVRAAFREGVDPMPPDVNAGGVMPEAAADTPAVRLGLGAVRGVGPELAGRIVSGRTAGGPYTDVDDLRRRVPLIDRALLPLWHAGALRDIANADRAPAVGQVPAGQLRLFDEGQGGEPCPADGQQADAEQGLGWPWPTTDGRVYLRVSRWGALDEDGIRAVTSRFPGAEAIVAAEAGARSGRRLPWSVAGSVWALRALRDVPGVRGAIRGLREPRGERADES